MKITLIGAGGKMGMRLTRNLIHSGYEMAYTEISDTGKARLADLGITVSLASEVVPGSDAVILAVPDKIL